MDKKLYFSSLFGGGMAGLVADVTLFPLDTLKTRLQCEQGFKNAGGFSKVYKGIGPQIVGSAPQAALFFCTYEAIKSNASPYVRENLLPFVHMSAASIGEVVACIVRVPIEIVKQRRQISTERTAWQIVRYTYKYDGFLGFYRGFGSTVVREVPFSFIQFPIIEYLKKLYGRTFKNNDVLEPWEVANCGAIAGGISAAITTPLDVIKTRIMLADSIGNSKVKFGYADVTLSILRENGYKGFFAGFVPRVIWITLGGFIFFGTYDFSRKIFYEDILHEKYVKN